MARGLTLRDADRRPGRGCWATIVEPGKSRATQAIVLLCRALGFRADRINEGRGGGMGGSGIHPMDGIARVAMTSRIERDVARTCKGVRVLGVVARA